MPRTAPLAATGLSDRFTLVIDGLCRATAAGLTRNRAAAPLLILIWTRLRRMAARFAALAARAATGALSPARCRAPAPPRPKRPRQRTPEGFAWLVRLVPEAACFGGQLQHLLAEPEMAALLAASPQAGRILRPLCRMLAVRPDPALLPPSIGSATPCEPPASAVVSGGAPPGPPPRPASLQWRSAVSGVPPPLPA